MYKDYRGSDADEVDLVVPIAYMRKYNAVAVKKPTKNFPVINSHDDPIVLIPYTSGIFKK